MNTFITVHKYLLMLGVVNTVKIVQDGEAVTLLTFVKDKDSIQLFILCQS